MTASTGHSIWIQPTDVAAEGADAVVAAVKEMGLGEISLAATYHAGRFLLPHDPKSSVKLLRHERHQIGLVDARWLASEPGKNNTEIEQRMWICSHAGHALCENDKRLVRRAVTNELCEASGGAHVVLRWSHPAEVHRPIVDPQPELVHPLGAPLERVEVWGAARSHGLRRLLTVHHRFRHGI